MTNEPTSAQDFMISVVIPIYNEEEGVEQLFRELFSVLDPMNGRFEIIAVNDGSRDSSLAKLRYTCLLEEGQSFGKGGRSGHVGARVRRTVSGDPFTIKQLRSAGVRSIILDITTNPSGGVEHALQKRQREFFPHDAIINGGLVASGNLPTRPGFIGVTSLTYIPDCTLFFNYDDEGLYQPWPDVVPHGSLGPVANPLRHPPPTSRLEAFLRPDFDENAMFNQIRREIDELMAAKAAAAPAAGGAD